MGRVEIEVGGRGPAASDAGVSSYELVLRGIWHFNKLSPASNAAAAACFERAIASYPRNAEAHLGLAMCLNSGWLYEFSRADLVKSLAVAERAVGLDPTNAACHAVLGFCRMYTDGLRSARQSYETALSLHSGNPSVLVEIGLLNVYDGDSRASHPYFEQAFRLNPLPPLWYAEYRAVAAFVEGRYAEALPAFVAVPEGAWDAMYAMACMGHLEDREQAIACRARIEAAGRKWDLIEGAKAEPFRDPEPSQRLIEGLEKALSF